MVWSRVGGIAVVALFLAGLAPLQAQAPGGVPAAQNTADELYLQAINLYNAGKFAEAVEGFRQFERDFGASEQGRKVLAGLRYPLAMSLLQLQKFDEAKEVIDVTLAATPPPTAEQREDLLFYKGVCEMQAGDGEAARRTFEEFVRAFPQSKQAGEAMLLFGTTWLLEEKFAEAARSFAEVKPRLSAIDRGRATVLELYALVSDGKLDEALTLVVEESPRADQIVQIAAFQTLALQLGAEFLEAGQYRKAIQALQRVWDRNRLTRHQTERMGALQDALAAAEAQPKGDPYRKFQLKQTIAKVRRELETLAKIPNFDSALSLRLASAYQAMQRYREAALIMEAMLDEMPPDPVVESASLALVQCWSQIERWPKAVAAADAFAKKFPKSKQLPLVLYLKGVAQQRDNDQTGAIATFDAVRTRFPDSDFAPRALFMRGFSQLLAEQNATAIATFDDFLRQHQKHELAEAATYWRGMGFSLDKRFPETREAMDVYLKAYPEGPHAGLAVFRKAYAAQSQRDYDPAIRELHAYLNRYAGHESNSEALLLLGDAYFAVGNLDYGIGAYKRIPPEETRFFEEGWFKIGKAYDKLGDQDKLRAHFEQFVAEHPRSPRVAEAVYWIGQTHQRQEQPDRAREVYWKAFTELGDDPTIRSVDDLIPALVRLYREPEAQRQLAARLSDLREQADGDGRKTLAMRALWAYAAVLKKQDPATAQRLMLQAAARADVSQANPLLLADFATALQAAGQTAEAEKMWRDLVKWNPRAPQKDRALYEIAQAELAKGNNAAALAAYNRFLQETSGSLLASKVHLQRGQLLERRGESDAAVKDYEALLALRTASGPDKAEALYRIAEIRMAQGKPHLAVPYYQRIYVMHRRWRDWVAKAYLRSGEAFEKLSDPDAARRTYQEMVEDEEYQGLTETQQARTRLDALGGPLPKPSPTPAEG